MALQLYDTATRSLREFTPRVPGVVSIYLCGATVQSPPHIGHVRNGVNFDILRRWLIHTGYRVVFCHNITDVEDKIIGKAADEDVPTWQIAYRNERAFSDAYATLGCLPPTIAPRATGHIPEIISFISRLLEAGHAYPAGGDVYYSVASFPAYGELSGQRPDALQPAADSETDDNKRDVRDFTLWKAAKPGEPVWDSPWGRGRPGWHIECSAMAERYLGAEFDIHGGGVDLIFPHHENEIAQSRGVGNGFANFWVHNAWVAAAGEKMSKSLGNSFLVTEAVREVRPIELRYYLAWPHYRSVIDASIPSMREAASAFRRLERFVVRAGELIGDIDPGTGMLCADFVTAMDDDLAVPRALAAVFEIATEGNKAFTAGDKDAVRGALAAVRRMLGLLGLDPVAPEWTGATDSGLARVVDALVTDMIEQRQIARAAGEFAAADAIRDRLTDAGIILEDSAAGTRWSFRTDSRVSNGKG